MDGSHLAGILIQEDGGDHVVTGMDIDMGTIGDTGMDTDMAIDTDMLLAEEQDMWLDIGPDRCRQDKVISTETELVELEILAQGHLQDLEIFQQVTGRRPGPQQGLLILLWVLDLLHSHLSPGLAKTTYIQTETAMYIRGIEVAIGNSAATASGIDRIRVQVA
jgi:hypothetical protein